MAEKITVKARRLGSIAGPKFLRIARSLIAFLLCNAVGAAVAFDDPPCEWVSERPVAPASQPCSAMGSVYNNSGGFFFDRNYYSLLQTYGTGPQFEFPPGFPLNLALWYGPTAPELPPRSTSPLTNSSPLVSMDALASPSNYPSRAVHQNIIDLATGVPLYQEVDFELPFGSAIYRQVRTHSSAVTPRSDNIGSCYSDNGEDVSSYFSDSAFWDWCGYGWQIGENPILLVDASYKDLDVNSGGKVSYLLPDAHHCIAFPKRADESCYERPQFVDAILTETANPNEYVVWFDRMSLKYTFELIEGMGQPLWIAAPCTCTELPPTPGCGCFYVGGTETEPDSYRTWVDAHEELGWPRAAILKRIEDRNGNRIEITHVGQSVSDCDDSGTDCHECCSNVNEWGQIKYVKLFPPGESPPAAWTMIYRDC